MGETSTLFNINLGKPKVPETLTKYVIYQITPLGKRKVSEYEVSGKRMDVLSTLAARGPSSIKALSDDTHMDVSQLKHLMEELKREQYVTTTTASGT